jgi:putative inorganic carbon (HCO3(-)) transporter
MRDLLIFGLVFGGLPFIFKRPSVGVLMFIRLSLMNPHRLTYGAAYDFPFAAVVAAVTLVALVMAYRPRTLPMTPLTAMLLVFIFWTTLTAFTALNPAEIVWKEWSRVMKTMLMAIVAMYALDEEREVQWLVWVIVLSLGFYGVKGGAFTLISGGGGRVLGPEGSYIADNNAMALANVTVAPLAWYLRTQARNKWVRRAMLGATLLIVLAAVGSYSRGALLAGATMLFFLWTKSRQKLPTALALVLLIPLVYLIMPATWFDRMSTIDNYQEDSSAMGRINAWKFALNVAGSHFMGGGFNAFSRELFYVYAPNPFDYKVAHSIYFQVLGEHGYVGLAIFVLILLFAWRTGSRIIKRCKDRPEKAWARELAAMIQVSLIGFATGGAFLALAYFDLLYFILALLVVTEKIVARQDRLALSENRRLEREAREAPALPA